MEEFGEHDVSPPTIRPFVPDPSVFSRQGSPQPIGTGVVAEPAEVKEGDPPDVDIAPAVLPGGVTPAEILDDEHLLGWEVPQQKKGYSNMQFLAFGAVLAGLAYITDEG